MSKIEMWNDNRRLQTQVFDLALDTVCIRSLDWDRERFDIEFGLQNGTTYNSYLIFGDKTALVDASHEKFNPLYMKTLSQQLKKAERGIDYILVSHTEPDHSGLIPKILDLYPDATVVGTKVRCPDFQLAQIWFQVCIQFLQGLTNRSFKNQVVKGGDKIDLGQGHEMQFIPAPNLHWPDTMFSFDPATGILFTCDAFGLHYCTQVMLMRKVLCDLVGFQNPFDLHLSEVEPHYRFYYDCLMKPNARSVLTALKRIKDIPYQTIANGHGPLIRFVRKL